MQDIHGYSGVFEGVPSYLKDWVLARSTTYYLGLSLSEPHVPSIKGVGTILFVYGIGCS